MKTAKVYYRGNLMTVATHLNSGQSIETDAPLDNNGKGSAFSPTDLTATSLACCMITTIEIKVKKPGIKILRMEAKVEKIMSPEPPRRIIEIKIDLSTTIDPDTPENRGIIEEIALNCPVAKSLHPDIFQNVSFIWR